MAFNITIANMATKIENETFLLACMVDSWSLEFRRLLKPHDRTSCGSWSDPLCPAGSTMTYSVMVQLYFSHCFPLSTAGLFAPKRKDVK